MHITKSHNRSSQKDVPYKNSAKSGEVATFLAVIGFVVMAVGFIAGNNAIGTRQFTDSNASARQECGATCVIAGIVGSVNGVQYGTSCSKNSDCINKASNLQCDTTRGNVTSGTCVYQFGKAPYNSGEKVACERSGGTWKQFPSSCANICGTRGQNCLHVLTWSCYCGSANRCWNWNDSTKTGSCQDSPIFVSGTHLQNSKSQS